MQVKCDSNKQKENKSQEISLEMQQLFVYSLLRVYQAIEEQKKENSSRNRFFF